MDLLPNHDELLQAETLTEKAYRALEEEIVTLRIPPGSVVSEAILSRRLGVGRTPSARPSSAWPASGWS